MTRSPPRQPPQERSRQFESHVGIADMDVVHNDGAPDRRSCSGTSEQTQRLPEGRRYPLPIRFFGVVAGQRFAIVKKHSLHLCVFRDSMVHRTKSSNQRKY